VIWCAARDGEGGQEQSQLKAFPSFYIPPVMEYIDRMEQLSFPGLEKTAFSVASLHGVSDDKDYWLARTPGERLEAVEIMRQIIYGYDPSTTRLQRVLTVTERASR
jgi:hypothetical protein